MKMPLPILANDVNLESQLGAASWAADAMFLVLAGAAACSIVRPSREILELVVADELVC